MINDMYNDVDAVAEEIKGGNLDLLPTLWDKVSRFIYSRASAWLTCKSNPIVEVDDLVNECYFVLLQAVRGWNPDKARFLTYLNYYLPNCFNAAYYGGRTAKSKLDPINNHASLDAPLQLDGDDKEITLLDTIVDTNTEAYYRNIEDVDFWHSVSAFLHKCIIQVDDNIGRACMLYMLDNDCDTISHVGRILYPEHNSDSIQYHFQRACRQLKRILNYNINKEAAKKLSLDYEIYGIGFNKFVHNNYTSNIEAAVIRKLEKETKLNDMRELLTDSG